MVAYDSDAKINQATIDYTSGSHIELPDYILTNNGYSSGYHISVTAKRNGIFHYGSNSRVMASGETFQFVSTWQNLYVWINGYFE